VKNAVCDMALLGICGRIQEWQHRYDRVAETASNFKDAMRRSFQTFFGSR
jgi:hypothetical protein